MARTFRQMKSYEQEYFISGIQQIGIGVPEVREAWRWYRKHFGFDIEIFNEKAVADLMLKYTNEQPVARHAVLAMNLNGGGGMEIWQATERKAESPSFELKLGDYGIFVSKLKAKNVDRLYGQLKKEGVNLLGKPEEDPLGRKTFFAKDKYGHIYQVVPVDNWFGRGRNLCGGIYGGIIGVSDIEKALPLYRDILKHDKVVYDMTGVFTDLNVLPGGEHKVRRVLLHNILPRKGAFSKLLGDNEIELIQVLDRKAEKIYRDRIWSDLGFIHMCFDVVRMDMLKEVCASKGFPFTVDSGNSFDMGEAAGRFAYVEDPDGTLIEFVETFKIPLLPKLGWYLNLKNRDNSKALPDFLVRMQRFLRKKEHHI